MKRILITIAISVYMTFMVVTIQVANKQTLATSDVTLDMITVMSRAFDEGGEGCQLLSNQCKDLSTWSPYWLAFQKPYIRDVYERRVQTECGWTGFFAKMPIGMTVAIELGDGLAGQCKDCKSNWINYCCALDISCCMHWGEGGGGPA